MSVKKICDIQIQLSILKNIMSVIIQSWLIGKGSLSGLFIKFTVKYSRSPLGKFKQRRKSTNILILLMNFLYVNFEYHCSELLSLAQNNLLLKCGLDNNQNNGPYKWRDGSPVTYKLWVGRYHNHTTNTAGKQDCVFIPTSKYIKPLFQLLK